MKNEFVFKINKTNGDKYLQIWKLNKETNNYEYLMACGNAEKLFNKLVKLKELFDQTKE